MSSTRTRTARTTGVLAALVAVLLVATSASPADASSARKKKHKKPPYSVSESVSRTSVTPGATVLVSGHVAPRAKGRTVTLQRRLGSGGWVSVARKTLPRSSSYAFGVKLSATGTYGLRTLVPKSKKRRAGVSAVRTVKVVPLGWRSVSGGATHSCGIRTDGSLWCWGRNFSGQLGSSTNIGTTTATPKPQRVGVGTSWVAVTTGQSSSCGVMRDHTAWCWGSNAYGQLGNVTNSGTTTANRVPLKVNGGSWASLSAGSGQHTCGTKLDGSAWCWGLDVAGQLGDGNSGSVTAHPTPVQVGAAHTWTQISTATSHTCGRQSDDTAWCWGNNAYGRIGNGTTTTPVTTPAKVGGTGWTSVVAGGQHSCGTKTDHSSWCWGYNYYGQDGVATNTGTSTGLTTPVRVGTGTDWVQLTGGAEHTCGLKSDKTLWCWGDNSFGSLGVATNAGTTTANPTPLRVTGSAGWTQTDGGSNHTCAVRTDGTAWCWGDNYSGQLGNPTNVGTTMANPAPLKVG